jgi:hypothetical protein
MDSMKAATTMITRHRVTAASVAATGPIASIIRCYVKPLPIVVAAMTRKT